MTDHEYNLNQGQKECAEAFFKFLFSDEKGFIISGPAGVGKTYLMNYIVDNTMPRYHEMCKLLGLPIEYDDVVMTATTNKAAEVLSKSTGRPAGTIHSFLNLRVTNDFNTGRSKLTKTNAWTVHQKLILFVDESSMIDSDLFKTIQEGTAKCKIVYVGDHSQLAPVGEKLSSVYRQGYPFYELTQQMRNNGQPALMNLCQQLRHTVHTGEFLPIAIVPGVIDYVSDEHGYDVIDHLFRVPNDQHKTLAYTNNRVVDYNTHIRALRNLPDEYQKGEKLVNNSPAKQGRKTLAAETEVTVLANHGLDTVNVDNGVDLEVQKLTVASVFSYFEYISVPVDRSHYDKLIKYYARQKNWQKYFWLKEEFFDLRPIDAATVHKSQGSTFDEVFIDLSNISTCNMSDQVARMLYVAVSRPRNRIFLYGDLAQKYGGLWFP